MSVILAVINGTPYKNKADFCKETGKLYEFINCIELMEKSDAFVSSLTIQGKFLMNYMKMFEILMVYIQSSRQCNWYLHLASLHEFIKYFFGHDQLNYAQHSPLYLENLVHSQSDDKQS